MCRLCGQTGGGVEPWPIFILAEGLKIEFLALSGRENRLVQTFRESCVHLDITHPSVHMTRDSRLSYLNHAQSD